MMRSSVIRSATAPSSTTSTSTTSDYGCSGNGDRSPCRKGHADQLEIFARDVHAVQPGMDEALAGDPRRDRRPPVPLPGTQASADLRIAAAPASARLASESLALGEPPDAELADAVDHAIGVVALQMIFASPLTLADGAIAPVLSLLHVAFHQAPP
jgi:hypothetical protein